MYRELREGLAILKVMELTPIDPQFILIKKMSLNENETPSNLIYISLVSPYFGTYSLAVARATTRVLGET